MCHTVIFPIFLVHAHACVARSKRKDADLVIFVV